MSAGPQPDSLEAPWHDQLVREGVDALWAYSRALQRGEAEWPDALLLLGDQVYADEVSPATLAFIEARRDTSEPPGEQVADFEEYTRLYRESWSDPDIRWLLSTVPSAMIFDDHDVHDDWNISWSWVEEMRAKPWWDARITGAFMAYWIYQHVGNLSPPELAEETMLELVKHDDDAGPRLREAARRWDRESAASRWAYYRDFGDSRLLVVDSRAARVLADGRREMVDEEEWDWIVDHSLGAFDHLVIASTLPVFMPARDPPPRGVERGRLRRALGQGRRAARRAPPARRRPRALGGVRRVVRPAVRLVAQSRHRRGRHDASRVHRPPRRRRAQQLPRRGRSRRGCSKPRLPDRLLAVPEPARAARAAHRPRHRIARVRR